MPRYKPWPIEVNKNLDSLLDATGLLESVSVVALRALKTNNLVLLGELLGDLDGALSRITKNINIIHQFYEEGPGRKKGRMAKWYKTVQMIEERHLYNLDLYHQRILECYQDNNWHCQELHFTNLPVICRHIHQLINEIPRESFFLEEARQIVRRHQDG